MTPSSPSHKTTPTELADAFLAKTYGVVSQDEWRAALIAFMTEHLGPSPTTVTREVLEAAERLCNAADEVGCKYFDTDTMDPPVDEMQSATLCLREALKAVPPSPAGGVPTRWHELKCWPEYFQSIADGRKGFEVRENDRDFQVGDGLHLREWDPGAQEYTGREQRVSVSYLMAGGFGLKPGTCVMSIQRLSPSTGLDGVGKDMEGRPQGLKEGA